MTHLRQRVSSHVFQSIARSALWPARSPSLSQAALVEDNPDPEILQDAQQPVEVIWRP